MSKSSSVFDQNASFVFPLSLQDVAEMKCFNGSHMKGVPF